MVTGCQLPAIRSPDVGGLHTSLSIFQTLQRIAVMDRAMRDAMNLARISLKSREHILRTRVKRSTCPTT
ncbi:hypothetical protein BN2475_270132 [Paraburkholderia ribeironis]|uniref:Uncharacterized protein n=1 Tax=Paraburkholderia ribeironis TaxID=1247936 RepID=A0A1N7S0D1_9BURK|nr:hypothetical protein BN2475_270132 [Paraburkholderia ribeironis]